MYEGTERHSFWFISQMASNNAAALADPPAERVNPTRWTNISLADARAILAKHYHSDDWKAELSDPRRCNEWYQRLNDAWGRERALNASIRVYVSGCPVYTEAQAWNKIKTYMTDTLDAHSVVH